LACSFRIRKVMKMVIKLPWIILIYMPKTISTWKSIESVHTAQKQLNKLVLNQLYYYDGIMHVNKYEKTC
jgi:hypothetical protein